MRWFNKSTMCIILSLFLILQATQANAYSYGKPDEEAIAQVYKTVYGELQKSSPNWNAMSSQFAAVKGEIAEKSHFGEHSPYIANYLSAKITGKQKAGLIENYQALLVLNIERRLNYTEKAFADQPKAKLLLAKGYATYRELKPTISHKIPSSTLQELEESFNVMLESLGNPGLFGLLKKEPNKAAFDLHKKKILDTLKPKFQLKLGIMLSVKQTKAYVNGKFAALDAAPYINSQRTFVPVRFIAENMGATVKWEASTQTVTITSGSKSAKLVIGSKAAVKNGSTKVTLDAPAEIINKRTFVPVRFVSEVLGYQVGWDGASQTVIIE